MDFSLTAKQQELIGLAKEISEKEIAPRALDIDKSGVMVLLLSVLLTP